MDYDGFQTFVLIKGFSNKIIKYLNIFLGLVHIKFDKSDMVGTYPTNGTLTSLL